MKVIIFLIFTIVNNVMSQCGSKSDAQCLDGNTYRKCVGGRPIGDRMTCPMGTECKNVKSICKVIITATTTEIPEETTTIKEQRPDKYCGTLSNAYCKTATTYQRCNNKKQFNKNRPIETCPIGKICTNDRQICVASSNSSPPSAQIYCTAKGQAGRFPVKSDKNCKDYVYCYVNNGKLNGIYYECVGKTKFNPMLQECVASGYKCPTKN